MNQIDVPFTRIFTMMRVERRLEGYNTLEIRRYPGPGASIAWTSFIEVDGQRLCSVPSLRVAVCVICYPQPSLVFFIDGIVHCAELSTTEVGNCFFAVSISLTQATANSKKGLKRKGEEKKDTEKWKVQSKPKCPSAIQTNSDRSKSQFSRKRKLHTTAIHQKDILDGSPIVTLSPISTLLITTSDTTQFNGFPRPDHSKSNHRKRVVYPQFLSMSHLLPLFLVRLLKIYLSKYYRNHGCDLAPFHQNQPQFSIPVPRAASTLSTITKAFKLMKDLSELGGKTGQEGRYLQTTSSSDKNKKKIPAGYPKRGIDCPI
ncbi:hypothetical protein K435DRAFT_796861 [Dendrothele bispora CBS 962.96]|uniref:Uncharacterized protein n=1 Tax=Dendrothele bispora (strain CBS 962.96) TaxID=1314807 RepID=A0A4S8M478_DENBC|nr:hypothetical protein K435DRAFT_796861 [Dendrothele bispora CBS 962.96]